jgi:phage/plasmid-like protein (TIGR03299 family)
MAHEVENMAWTNEVPWHGLGVEVSNDLTPDEMLVKAGLDWTVSKRPVYFPKFGTDQTTLKLIPNKFALTRDSDESLLDIVGDAYKPVQNVDALSFFKRFVDSGGMKMETAGSLRKGQFIWGLAKIEEAFNVGKTDEDRIEGYLLLTQPHKFGFSMIAALTPIRVVCMNTMRLALGEKLGGKSRNTTGVFRMPHQRAFDETVQQAAVQALGLARDGMLQLQEAANVLSNVRIKQTDLVDYFHNVANTEMLVAEEGVDPYDPENFSRTIKTLLDAVDEAPGSQLKTAQGTLWGAYNAVTYVADHMLGRTDDSRVVSAWFGQGGNMKRRALDIALDLAKAA